MTFQSVSSTGGQSGIRVSSGGTTTATSSSRTGAGALNALIQDNTFQTATTGIANAGGGPSLTIRNNSFAATVAGNFSILGAACIDVLGNSGGGGGGSISAGTGAIDMERLLSPGLESLGLNLDNPSLALPTIAGLNFVARADGFCPVPP